MLQRDMMLGRAKPLNAHGDRITGVVKKTFLEDYKKIILILIS